MLSEMKWLTAPRVGRVRGRFEASCLTRLPESNALIKDFAKCLHGCVASGYSSGLRRHITPHDRQGETGKEMMGF